MLHGTKNESAAVLFFEKLSFLRGLREVGIVADKNMAKMACSPDGVCNLKLSEEFRSLSYDE